MQLSQRGLELIASHEGFVDHVYRDPVGVETVGYGTTRPEAIERYRHSGISREQALAELRGDVERFESAMRRLITVPLNQNQWDAVVSLVYNVGEGVITPAQSTFARLLNAGDYEAAASQMLRWTKAGDPPRDLAGLVRRRQEERALFLEPVAAPDPPQPVELPDERHRLTSLVSPNGRHVLQAQEDGNLVLYTEGHPLWATGTHGHPGATAWHQPDGNLVVYDAERRPLWDSGTWHYPGSTLVVQDDGNVVIYGELLPASTLGGAAAVLHKPVWDTGTWERPFTPLPEDPPAPEPDGDRGHPDPVGQIDAWGFEDGVAGFQLAFAPWDLAVDGDAGAQTARAVQWVVDNGGRMSSYFVLDELRSKGNGRIKSHRDLLRWADRVRERKGPWTPVSAYRDPAHNARVGGAANSQHLYGRAFDVPESLGLTVGEAADLGAAGVGDCEGITLHGDVRDAPARWAYC